MANLDQLLLDFAAGPADVAAARALTGQPPGALLALVAKLGADAKRAHLEALGEAGMPKKVKKAARVAAYKLKSAGVAAEVKRAAARVDLRVDIPLDKVALVGAPGIDGHIWLVLADLGEDLGAEVDLRDETKPPEIRVTESGLSRSRLRRFKRDIDNPRVSLVDADLAVRRIERLDAQLADYAGGRPPAWGHVLRWRDRAVALGADAGRVDASAHLRVPAEAPSAEALTALLSTPLVGFMAPPESTLEVIAEPVASLMHSDDPIDEADFRARFAQLLETAADAWLEAEGQRELLATWLEDDADVLYALGEEAMATTCLAVAAQARVHEGDGSAWQFLRLSFKAAIDVDFAWLHRQAHVAGVARHDHDH